MKDCLKKIEAADFRRLFKLLVIAALLVVVDCGALTAIMFRTQLAELHTLDKMEEQTEAQLDGQAPADERGGPERSANRERDDNEIDVFDEGLVTRPSAGAIATAITSVILCGLCALAYWLMVAAWLYKASAKAGMNRALWPLLGLVFNLLAVLAFLILRERLAHCPVCSTWQKNGRYCVNCGMELAPLCPKCNCVCGAAERYCPFCGAALKVRHKDRAE